MQVNSDFISRLLYSQVYQIPTEKEKAVDHTLDKIIGFNGGHLRSLDINYCTLLTSSCIERNLLRCMALEYVNLSHTAVTSIECLIQCIELKSLVLSGCKELIWSNVTPYFYYWPYLQLLSLNYTSFDAIESLSCLTCLRSLDLSYSKITHIDTIAGFTRIEELNLEGIILSDEEYLISNSILTIETLDCLRLLNIVDTPLSNIEWKQLFPMRSIYYETTMRKYQLLEAVLSDNDELAYQLLSQGEDINQHIGSWGEEIITKQWKMKISNQKEEVITYFYRFTHSNPQLQPTYLHIAIFFFAERIIKLLIKLGIALNEVNVWFGYLTEKDLLKVLSGIKSKAQIKAIRSFHPIITLREYIDAVHQQHIHRYTVPGMHEENVNWKILCNNIRKRVLTAVFGDNYQIAKKKEGMSSPIAALGSPSGNRPINAADLIVEDITSEELLEDSNRGEVEMLPVVPKTEVLSFDKSDMLRMKRTREMPNMIREREIPCREWNEHPMVRKCIGKPYQTADRAVDYLGKKSFWMESRQVEYDKRHQSQETELVKEKIEWNSMTEGQKNKLRELAVLRYPYKAVHPPDYSPSRPLNVIKDEFNQNLQKYRHIVDNDEEFITKNKAAVVEAVESDDDDVQMFSEADDDDDGLDDMSI